MLSRTATIAASLLSLATTTASSSRGADEAMVAKSVVKVHATSKRPDLFRPWIKADAAETSGTGVVIDGRRILTAAHVVGYATQVLIQPDQSGEKLAATVKAIAPEVDLALLTLADDDGFFDAHPPLPRASALPKLRDAVLAHGYPTGGETLSITRGIVSRIEYDAQYQTAMALRVQIDAAINPGNTGGPATVDGRMVGLISSRLRASDNIGYLVPDEEIELFLKDVADGTYDGKPILYDVLQFTQNEALRARLKMPRGMSGMLVWRPDGDGPDYPLKRWDVITRIGATPVDSAGQVRIDGLTLHHAYLVQKLARGGKVRLGVIRAGEEIEVEAPAPSRSARPVLMPPLLDGYPSYFVWGPLVFSGASGDFVQGFARKDYAERWFPYLVIQKSALLDRRYDRPAFEGEQLVIVAAMLPHKLVRGYNDPMTAVVDEVDGVKIKNLRHLAERLRDAKGDQVVVSFLDHQADVLVLDRRAVLAASEQILSENGIRKAYSDDLRAVLAPEK